MADPVDPGIPGVCGEDQGLPVHTQSHPKSSTGLKSARLKAKALSSQRASKAEEKDTQRCQKAIDKGIAKAEREAEQRRGASFPREEMVEISRALPAQHLSCPIDVKQQWEPPSKWMKAAPEATFPPTAVGLHPWDSQGPEITNQMKILISEAITQGIAAGLQHQSAP
ncbi:hypothetical protein E2320_017974, partial [Naja naja]